MAHPLTQRLCHILLTIVVASIAPTTVASESLPLPATDVVEQAVVGLSTIRDLDDLSRSLWPEWKISDTAFALHGRDGGFCVLINHPDAPETFESARTSGRSRERYHVSAAMGIGPDQSVMNEAVTAFIHWREFQTAPLPVAFERAFRAHLQQECSDLLRIEPPIDGYPVTPENLALADIECELLARAATAPDDSLEKWTLEFVAVRHYRRMRMNSPAAEAYERRLERLGGISLYIRALAGAEAPGHLRSEDAELLLGEPGGLAGARACILEPSGLDWYRFERYGASGAVLCGLLDRFHPEWKEEVDLCRDPCEVLYEATLTELPKALEVLPSHDLLARVEEKAEYIESLKSDAERLYGGIVEGEEQRLVVNMGPLHSTSVSYDPENLEYVDENRMVHKRVIRIEFSGGTRVHILGRPSAVNIGYDEFDIKQLTIAAPDGYSVKIGGREAVLTHGVHEFDQPLSVSADGLLIEARAGVIMVGEDKITFMLHR